MKLPLYTVLILLNQGRKSRYDSLDIGLKELPCLQIASFHHNSGGFSIVKLPSIMSVKLLLYRVQVLLVELVQVVMILGIPPIRKCLLTQTHQRLR